MWLNQLQIAVIEKNTSKLNELIGDIPDLKIKKDIDSAICLLDEASLLLTSLRDDKKSSMQQMQKTIKFLKATESKKSSSLDIKL